MTSNTGVLGMATSSSPLMNLKNVTEGIKENVREATPIFLQTKAAQGIAGAFVFAALFLTCQQVCCSSLAFFYHYNCFVEMWYSRSFMCRERESAEEEKRGNSWEKLCWRINARVLWRKCFSPVFCIYLDFWRMGRTNYKFFTIFFLYE